MTRTKVMLAWNVLLTLLLAILVMAFIILFKQHLDRHDELRTELLDYNSRTIEQKFEKMIDSGALEQKIKAMINKNMAD